MERSPTNPFILYLAATLHQSYINSIVKEISFSSDLPK